MFCFLPPNEELKLVCVENKLLKFTGCLRPIFASCSGGTKPASIQYPKFSNCIFAGLNSGLIVKQFLNASIAAPKLPSSRSNKPKL